MDIGFTGTQKGVTPEQHEVLLALLFAESTVRKVTGHHGLCIGADTEFHRICRNLAIPIIGHPPINRSKVTDFAPEEFIYMAEPKEYLDRNKDIVICSKSLIACPAEEEEILRSGTWSTVRFARIIGIKRYIIFPSGRIEDDNGHSNS